LAVIVTLVWTVGPLRISGWPVLPGFGRAGLLSPFYTAGAFFFITLQQPHEWTMLSFAAMESLSCWRPASRTDRHHPIRLRGNDLNSFPITRDHRAPKHAPGLRVLGWRSPDQRIARLPMARRRFREVTSIPGKPVAAVMASRPRKDDNSNSRGQSTIYTD
jgi:hypothetical protein